MATVGKTVGRQFGNYARSRREERGMTLRELSRKSRIPLATLFQIEAGTNPKLSRVKQLAQAFGEDLPNFLRPVFGRQEPQV